MQEPTSSGTFEMDSLGSKTWTPSPPKPAAPPEKRPSRRMKSRARR